MIFFLLNYTKGKQYQGVVCTFKHLKIQIYFMYICTVTQSVHSSVTPSRIP